MQVPLCACFNTVLGMRMYSGSERKESEREKGPCEVLWQESISVSQPDGTSEFSIKSFKKMQTLGPLLYTHQIRILAFVF